MTSQVSIWLAFSAGLLTFLSPCILPLIPIYLSFISGVSVENIKQGKQRFFVVINALLFIFGFTAVFVLLGATATFVGQILNQYIDVFIKISAIFLIIMGLHLIGIFRINFLLTEKKLHMQFKTFSWLRPILFGFTFAFSWTPCVGPILSGILIMASAQESVFKGMQLLIFFSLGVSLPFLLTALVFDRASKFFSLFKIAWIGIISGLFLIIIGILMLTGVYWRLFFI